MKTLLFLLFPLITWAQLSISGLWPEPIGGQPGQVRIYGNEGPYWGYLDQQNILENLLIRGSSRPGLLRIADNFGKESHIFSIGGDLAFKMYSDSARNISGSFRIQGSNGQDLFTFRQDGSIRFTRFQSKVDGISINQDYHIPVIDPAGNLIYFKVRGSVLRLILRQ